MKNTTVMMFSISLISSVSPPVIGTMESSSDIQATTSKPSHSLSACLLENKYYLKRSQVPAFGSWDCNDNDFPIPFTECFESARQAGLIHYSYSQDSDLYVTGDLYQNHIVTPTMIVVPHRMKKGSYKEGRKEAWVMCDNCEKESPRHAAPTAKPIPKKPVDEDLYKISPDLLYPKSKMKGIRGFLSSCLLPTSGC